MSDTFIPEQTITEAVARAYALDRLSDGVVLSYHAGQPDAVRIVQARGRAILPGIRLADAAELALWAHGGDAASLERYIRAAYAENRVTWKHSYSSARYEIEDGRPLDLEFIDTLGIPRTRYAIGGVWVPNEHAYKLIKRFNMEAPNATPQSGSVAYRPVVQEQTT